MPKSIAAQQKNLSLELVKVIAACFVVFIHVPFPGEWGDVVTCLARFAVPFFFGVSGLYSVGIRAEHIQKRMVHLLKLHGIAALVAIVVGCLGAESGAEYLRWESWPRMRDLARWFLIQINFYGGHLWYLSALLLCYGVLLGYTRFWQGEKQDNRPLYYGGLILFAAHCVLALLLGAEKVDIPYRSYRNGWLTGIPMFTMGMFLREYEDRLVRNFQLTDRKMLLLMALGICLSLIQEKGGYSAEIPMGMFLTVPVLLLFLRRHPGLLVKNVWIQRAVSRFGVVSTAIYILHIAVKDLYNLYLKDMACALLGTKEDTLMPILVLGLSFLAALVWERIDWLFTRKK